MSRCPNCEQEAPAGDRYCPRCGMDLYWDPSPSLPGSSVAEIGHIVLGILTALTSVFTGVGVLIVIAVYFSMRAGGSPFVRGLGIGLVVLVALLLGMIAICFATIGNGRW